MILIIATRHTMPIGSMAIAGDAHATMLCAAASMHGHHCDIMRVPTPAAMRGAHDAHAAATRLSYEHDAAQFRHCRMRAAITALIFEAPRG